MSQPADSARLLLFRQVFGAPIEGYTSRPIRAGEKGCRVERVHFTQTRGGRAPGTAILKFGREEVDGRTHTATREFEFYARYGENAGLRLPRVYFNQIDPETGRQVLILEDLKTSYRFPRTSHRWTVAELRHALGAYARLHVLGRSLLPEESDRGWLFSYLEPPIDLDDLRGDYEELVAGDHWSPIPGLEDLIEEAGHGVRELTARPPTLLHHDVWPSNVALPRDQDAEAVLVDWEMVGWGPAEVDLAYLFLEPYQGARELPAATVWDVYWQERQKLEGSIPSRELRQGIQRQAEVLLALSLIRVARSVARSPYPINTRPGAYWRVMHETLPSRLRGLIAGQVR